MSCSWLRPVVNKKWRNDAIDKAIQMLANNNWQFDAIAVRGVSGIAFGSILAHMLGKSLIIVRKPNDGSHSGRLVEEPVIDVDDKIITQTRFIIVDDLIDRGNTMVEILNALKISPVRSVWQCVGIYLYAPMACSFPTKENFDIIQSYPILPERVHMSPLRY